MAEPIEAKEAPEIPISPGVTKDLEMTIDQTIQPEAELGNLHSLI